MRANLERGTLNIIAEIVEKDPVKSIDMTTRSVGLTDRSISRLTDFNQILKMNFWNYRKKAYKRVRWEAKVEVLCVVMSLCLIDFGSHLYYATLCTLQPIQ